MVTPLAEPPPALVFFCDSCGTHTEMRANDASHEPAQITMKTIDSNDSSKPHTDIRQRTSRVRTFGIRLAADDARFTGPRFGAARALPAVPFESAAGFEAAGFGSRTFWNARTASAIATRARSRSGRSFVKTAWSRRPDPDPMAAACSNCAACDKAIAALNKIRSAWRCRKRDTDASFQLPSRVTVPLFAAASRPSPCGINPTLVLCTTTSQQALSSERV